MTIRDEGGLRAGSGPAPASFLVLKGDFLEDPEVILGPRWVILDGTLVSR